MCVKTKGIYKRVENLNLFFTTKQVAQEYIDNYCISNSDCKYFYREESAFMGYASIEEYEQACPEIEIKRILKKLNDLTIVVNYGDLNSLTKFVKGRVKSKAYIKYNQVGLIKVEVKSYGSYFTLPNGLKIFLNPEEHKDFERQYEQLTKEASVLAEELGEARKKYQNIEREDEELE